MSLFRSVAILAVFCLPLVHSIGCGGGGSAPDNDPFATYQDCWDDHHTMEGFSVQKSIEICCIDHPIGSAPMNTVCGDTAATCMTYVTANLAASDATATDISTACTSYVTDRAG